MNPDLSFVDVITDKVKRYWYWVALLGILLLVWAAPALISTAITFVVAVALVVVVFGLVLHVTPVGWTETKTDSDVVKAAKIVGVAIVFAGLCWLGSAMWQQEHQTAQMQQFNDELQHMDSMRMAK